MKWGWKEPTRLFAEGKKKLSRRYRTIMNILHKSMDFELRIYRECSTQLRFPSPIITFLTNFKCEKWEVTIAYSFSYSLVWNSSVWTKSEAKAFMLLFHSYSSTLCLEKQPLSNEVGSVWFKDSDFNVGFSASPTRLGREDARKEHETACMTAAAIWQA